MLRIENARFYSSLHKVAGNHRLRIDHRDMAKTAFSSSNNHCEFKGRTLEICNARNVFFITGRYRGIRKHLGGPQHKLIEVFQRKVNPLFGSRLLYRWGEFEPRTKRTTISSPGELLQEVCIEFFKRSRAIKQFITKN